MGHMHIIAQIIGPHNYLIPLKENLQIVLLFKCNSKLLRQLNFHHASPTLIIHPIHSNPIPIAPNKL